mgnify:CR=1 FL=1
MRGPVWLLWPGLAYLAFFLWAPTALVVAVSFARRDAYGAVRWEWNADNYVRMLDPLYLRIFAESAGLAALCTLICLAVGYPLAYYISIQDKQRQRRWLFAIMMPFWINFLVRTYGWILLLQNQGVVNTALRQLGWIERPLSLMYNPGAVLVGFVYTLLPFMILPIYVSLEQIDRKLFDAAADLGASPARRFRHVTFPLTLPGTVAGCALVFVSALGLFVVSDLLGGSKTMLWSNLIQNQFLSARDWPFGAALSVAMMLFSAAVVFAGYRLARVRLGEGGIG